MAKKKVKPKKTVLTEAYRDHSKGMNSHAFFKIDSREMSKDLVQETFMKTWVYLVKGGKIDIMKAFLYHVLNQLIIDEYRKNKTTSLDALMEKGYEPSIEYSKHLYDVFDNEKISLLIQHLPVKYKKIMRMRYVQGLSLKEISILTGQSKNTVAVQSHRGLKKLKELYNK